MYFHMKPLKYMVTLPIFTCLLLCCRKHSLSCPGRAVWAISQFWNDAERSKCGALAQPSFAVAEGYKREPNCRNSGFPAARWLFPSHSVPSTGFGAQVQNVTGFPARCFGDVVQTLISFQMKSIIFSNRNLPRPEKIKSQIHIIRGLLWLVDKAKAVLQEQRVD